MVSWTRELVRNGRLFRFCVYFNMWKYGQIYFNVWKKKIKEEYSILGLTNECVRRATFWRNMEEGKLKVCFGIFKIVVLFWTFMQKCQVHDWITSSGVGRVPTGDHLRIISIHVVEITCIIGHTMEKKQRGIEPPGILHKSG